MSGELHLSKLDAARRQLETAIILYFNDADPVPIHALTAGAYDVIRDINVHRGGAPVYIKDGLLQSVKPERQEEVRVKINEAQNFFKHANRDPDKVIKFRPGSTRFLLLEACQKYHELTSELPPLMDLFCRWMMLEVPELFNVPPELVSMTQTLIDKHGPLTRHEYFTLMLPAIYSKI
jgi:hypothetical protein